MIEFMLLIITLMLGVIGYGALDMLIHSALLLPPHRLWQLRTLRVLVVLLVVSAELLLYLKFFQ